MTDEITLLKITTKSKLLNKLNKPIAEKYRKVVDVCCGVLVIMLIGFALFFL